MINTNNVQETLIKNLILLRKSSGLTQIELGGKINYSDKTISKWEKRDSCPNIEAICKLANFYGVSVDDLLSDALDNEQRAVEVKQKRYSKLIISLLAVIAVWFIASMIFVRYFISSTPGAWLIFIHAIPVTAAVLLVFNSMWGNRRFNYLIISCMVWAVLTSVFLSMLSNASVMWIIYLIGIPIQLAIILWSQMTRKRRK